MEYEGGADKETSDGSHGVKTSIHHPKSFKFILTIICRENVLSFVIFRHEKNANNMTE